MTCTTNNSVQSTFASAITSPMYRSNFNISISPFDGDPKQLEFFTTQVTEISNCNEWNDRVVLTYATSNLQGPARTFFIQMSEYHPFPSTQDLFSVLREQFKRKNA